MHPPITPGEILLEEYLRPIGISQNAMARAIGVPPRVVNEIVLGRRSITPAMSIRFGAFFGQTESFWYALQMECDFRALAKDRKRLTAAIRPASELIAARALPENRNDDLPGAPRRVAALVFPGFEVLDLFGPVELLSMHEAHFSVHLAAAQKGEITSAQNVKVVAAHSFQDDPDFDILLVPGGRGTRAEVSNPVLLDWLVRAADRAEFVASVCTGSALLAAAGLLDGRKATSNKLAFSWVVSQGPRVEWLRQARWTCDGKFFTSSGISAGMDMALALIEKILGRPASLDAARRAEYIWNPDPHTDPFCPDVADSGA